MVAVAPETVTSSVSQGSVFAVSFTRYCTSYPSTGAVVVAAIAVQLTSSFAAAPEAASTVGCTWSVRHNHIGNADGHLDVSSSAVSALL